MIAGDPPLGHGVGTTPPSLLNGLTVSPNRWRTSWREIGTTIRSTLSKASHVTLRFYRLASGHLVQSGSDPGPRRRVRLSARTAVGLPRYPWSTGATITASMAWTS